MADITGVRASNIARFEGATCTPTLIMLEKYANALGKHIEIRVCEDK
jgi:predicted transcriptional regulator